MEVSAFYIPYTKCFLYFGSYLLPVTSYVQLVSLQESRYGVSPIISHHRCPVIESEWARMEAVASRRVGLLVCTYLCITFIIHFPNVSQIIISECRIGLLEEVSAHTRMYTHTVRIEKA